MSLVYAGGGGGGGKRRQAALSTPAQQCLHGCQTLSAASPEADAEHCEQQVEHLGRCQPLGQRCSCPCCHSTCRSSPCERQEASKATGLASLTTARCRRAARSSTRLPTPANALHSRIPCSNVHLLTLKDTGSSYLVRLAHLYQVSKGAVGARVSQGGSAGGSLYPLYRHAQPTSRWSAPHAVSDQLLAPCPICLDAPQKGEDPALAQPVTENLNAVLQLLQYHAVRGWGVGWPCAWEGEEGEVCGRQAADKHT